MAYLQVAVMKTASPAEEEAWSWLTQAIAEFLEIAFVWLVGRQIAVDLEPNAGFNEYRSRPSHGSPPSCDAS